MVVLVPMIRSMQSQRVDGQKHRMKMGICKLFRKFSGLCYISPSKFSPNLIFFSSRQESLLHLRDSLLSAEIAKDSAATVLHLLEATPSSEAIDRALGAQIGLQAVSPGRPIAYDTMNIGGTEVT